MAEVRYLEMLKLGLAYLEADPEVDALMITLVRRRLDEFESRYRRLSPVVHQGFSVGSFAAPVSIELACNDLRRW